MNNSDFTIGCKSCFIYLREVLAVSWCEYECRWYFGCLAESSSDSREHSGSLVHAWWPTEFCRISLALSICYICWMWAQGKHTWKSKINKRLQFLGSCVYKCEVSVVKSAYSPITDDPSNNFNVFLRVKYCWSDLVHCILLMFSLIQLVIRL